MESGGLTHVFPSPGALAAADYSPIGLPAKRAETIRSLAGAVQSGDLAFGAVADPALWMERFRALPGIGEWTAQYVAMRALGEPDAFPAGDLGLLRASGAAGPKQLEQLAEQWRPWRAYAAMYLWQAQKENSNDALHLHGKPRRATVAGRG